MLLFENKDASAEDPIKALAKRLPPDDLVEIGENNECWLFVNRTTRLLEFVSKETGKVVARSAIDETAGISERQLGAARDALNFEVVLER